MVVGGGMGMVVVGRWFGAGVVGSIGEVVGRVGRRVGS